MWVTDFKQLLTRILNIIYFVESITRISEKKKKSRPLIKAGNHRKFAMHSTAQKCFRTFSNLQQKRAQYFIKICCHPQTQAYSVLNFICCFSIQLLDLLILAIIKEFVIYSHLTAALFQFTLLTENKKAQTIQKVCQKSNRS